MAAALENKLGVKAILENDANAAAVGENWLGVSKGYKNSIYVTLGTGVGGGIIVDGKVLRGGGAERLEKSGIFALRHSARPAAAAPSAASNNTLRLRRLFA